MGTGNPLSAVVLGIAIVIAIFALFVLALYIGIGISELLTVTPMPGRD